MSEEKETTVNTTEWKEYDDFYAAHELQLFGMSFPKELGEKLFFKLKNSFIYKFIHTYNQLFVIVLQDYYPY